MGVFGMCRFCGSDWCDGECVTEKHAKELKAAQDEMAQLREQVARYKRILDIHDLADYQDEDPA